jgi:hypothetical protein
LRRELEEACRNTAKMQNGAPLEAPKTLPDPPQRTRVARAMVSTTAPGSIPTTLGGRLPPTSILSRREYGLRQLRK